MQCHSLKHCWVVTIDNVQVVLWEKRNVAAVKKLNRHGKHQGGTLCSMKGSICSSLLLQLGRSDVAQQNHRIMRGNYSSISHHTIKQLTVQVVKACLHRGWHKYVCLIIITIHSVNTTIVDIVIFICSKDLWWTWHGQVMYNSVMTLQLLLCVYIKTRVVHHIFYGSSSIRKKLSDKVNKRRVACFWLDE